MNEAIEDLAVKYCTTTAEQLENAEPESRAYLLAMIITSTIDLMVKYKGPQATAERLNEIANELLAIENATKMKKH